MSDIFDEDVYAAINLETCVKGRTTVGGPSADSVEAQVQKVLVAL